MTNGPSPRSNAAAHDLWSQIFQRAAADPNATLQDPDHDKKADENRLTTALKEAGWPDDQIEMMRMAALTSQEPIDFPTSPGVAPHLERQLRKIAEPIISAMDAMGHSSHQAVTLGIEPKIGVSASMTNVIMTEEGILSVSSFLFRWCGLVARAYTRTLNLDPFHWSEAPPDKEKDRSLLLNRPDIAAYWLRIFMSFVTTGTHIMAPFRPSKQNEILLFEQIAWSMEYFVLAHEYGHHILSHRSTDADPLIQEFEADAFAMKICSQLEYEPFKFLHNPYNVTGAGGSLILRSLSSLDFMEEGLGNKRNRDTHPIAAERISRITNRHALQPQKLAMDRNFNDTVARIMDTVDELLAVFLARGGSKLVSDTRSSIWSDSGGWPLG